jgi:anthranilate synthase/aminodeoxychorismate synthase-like glutamine amidotransferase
MILFIDNYDSFTFNLVSMMGELEADLRVVRNDEITPEGARAMRPEGIVLSPGPGTPSDSGICPEIVRHLAADVPIFGVCLGHQVLVEVFGGRVVRAAKPMHGKVSPVVHDGSGLLQGLPSPFPAGRYHSLVAATEDFPPDLLVQGTTPDGEIMAVKHRSFPCHGVQFHPESILTPDGGIILRNFVQFCRERAHA